jgi:IMP dehydrogenase/GMP reductase
MNKFDFNDILLKPAAVSDITSRKQIDPYTEQRSLPLMAAPMDTVVSEDNIIDYELLGIITCVPRNNSMRQTLQYEDSTNRFISLSLDDISDRLETNNLSPNGRYLIDVANGHMISMLDMTKAIKARYPFITLMVGNVANPETYTSLSNAGADYVRVGIGNGGGCSTTLHTGIGYPMGSLISECYTESCKLDNPAKIVADGGMQNYSDIIKALALGADYVMVGSLFNKAIESAGDNYLWKKIKVSQRMAKFAYRHKIPVYKKFRGMSTKEVQRKWGNQILKTSEGVVRVRRVEYTIGQWTENFTDYLRSAMSYSNSKTLDDFIGGPEIIHITDNSYNRFKK